MQKVYLLKPYEGHGANEVVAVSNNIAFGLIDNGTARLATNRDFLVKPDFANASSKAINTCIPCNLRKIRRTNK